MGGETDATQPMAIADCPTLGQSLAWRPAAAVEKSPSALDALNRLLVREARSWTGVVCARSSASVSGSVSTRSRCRQRPRPRTGKTPIGCPQVAPLGHPLRFVSQEVQSAQGEGSIHLELLVVPAAIAFGEGGPGAPRAAGVPGGLQPGAQRRGYRQPLEAPRLDPL